MLVNLALVTMPSGRSVVVLDADVRRPRIHRLLGLPNDVGLIDILAGRAQAHHAIQTGKATDAPRAVEGSLAVVTAGRDRASGAELLGQAPLRETVRYLTDRYDVASSIHRPSLPPRTPFCSRPS